MWLRGTRTFFHLLPSPGSNLQPVRLRGGWGRSQRGLQHTGSGLGAFCPCSGHVTARCLGFPQTGSRAQGWGPPCSKPTSPPPVGSRRSRTPGPAVPQLTPKSPPAAQGALLGEASCPERGHPEVGAPQQARTGRSRAVLVGRGAGHSSFPGRFSINTEPPGEGEALFPCSAARDPGGSLGQAV